MNAKTNSILEQQPEHFLWSLNRGVATITLNHPERKNPLTFESYAEMRDLFRKLVYVDEVKEMQDGKATPDDIVAGKGSSGEDLLAKNQGELYQKIQAKIGYLQMQQ